VFFGKVDYEDHFSNQFTNYIVEGSPAEVQQEIELESASLVANGFINPSGSQLGPRYYVLDKANFLNVLGNMNVASLWNFPIPAQFKDPGTPRDGWTDDNGIKRAPPPSEKPKPKGKGGQLNVSLRTYLILLLETWQGVFTGPGGKLIPGTGGVPQRWLEWLTQLISHFDRYSPTQIYGFLARVNFADATFKV
jgi:hypothetical protein